MHGETRGGARRVTLARVATGGDEAPPHLPKCGHTGGRLWAAAETQQPEGRPSSAEGRMLTRAGSGAEAPPHLQKGGRARWRRSAAETQPPEDQPSSAEERTRARAALKLASPPKRLTRRSGRRTQGRWDARRNAWRMWGHEGAQNDGGASSHGGGAEAPPLHPKGLTHRRGEGAEATRNEKAGRRGEAPPRRQTKQRGGADAGGAKACLTSKKADALEQGAHAQTPADAGRTEGRGEAYLTGGRKGDDGGGGRRRRGERGRRGVL